MGTAVNQRRHFTNAKSSEITPKVTLKIQILITLETNMFSKSLLFKNV